jgi:hypothetical protein
MAYVVVAVLVLLSGAPVSAQQPGPHGGDKQPAGPAQPMEADQQGASPHMMHMCRQMMEHSGPMGGGGMMGGGMMGGGMMGGGMMGGGMMGGGMMGRMPMMSGDPKHQAEMMAMRGEMMKAMGDIMIKYAERMRPAN